MIENGEGETGLTREIQGEDGTLKKVPWMNLFATGSEHIPRIQ
jgi:hypothetical protein